MNHIFDSVPTWVDIAKIDYRICGDGDNSFLQVSYHRPSGHAIIFQFHPFGDQSKGDLLQANKQFMEWYGKMFVPIEGMTVSAPESLITPDFFTDNSSRLKDLVEFLQYGLQSMLLQQPKSFLLKKEEDNFIILKVDFEQFKEGELEIDFQQDDSLTEDNKIVIKDLIQLYNKGYNNREIAENLQRKLQQINNIYNRKIKTSPTLFRYLIDKNLWNNKRLANRINNCYAVNDNGCWLFLFYIEKVSNQPYLQSQFKSINVRKYFYELNNKATLKDDELLRSSCGNTNCVNPDHCKIINNKFHASGKQLLAGNPELSLRKHQTKAAIELYNCGVILSQITKILFGKNNDFSFIRHFGTLLNSNYGIKGEWGKTIINAEEWHKRNAHPKNVIVQENYIFNKGCWEWKRVNTVMKKVPARRFIFELSNSIELSAEDVLTRTCNTKECINPNHFVLEKKVEKEKCVFEIVSLKDGSKNTFNNKIAAMEFMNCSKSRFYLALQMKKSIVKGFYIREIKQ